MVPNKARNEEGRVIRRHMLIKERRGTLDSSN